MASKMILKTLAVCLFSAAVISSLAGQDIVYKEDPEVGAREAELGRQPRRARQFFRDFQNRILFGTDCEPGSNMHANYFRWLKTGDEYFDYWGYPGPGRWEIHGMELPDAVLEKVYHKKAERLFAQFKGTSGVRQ
jgi:uncharacterized protein